MKSRQTKKKDEVNYTSSDMKQFKRSNHSNKELVERYIFPHSISKEEQVQQDQLFFNIRKERIAKQTTEQKILWGLMQLKFSIEDYLRSDKYDLNFKFGYFLKEYIQILNKKSKDFASEINLEPTELSQLINSHRKPNEKIFIRLELHSNKFIPALFWFKLFEKERAYEIISDQKLRKRESKLVKNKINIPSTFK